MCLNNCYFLSEFYRASKRHGGGEAESKKHTRREREFGISPIMLFRGDGDYSVVYTVSLPQRTFIITTTRSSSMFFLSLLSALDFQNKIPQHQYGWDSRGGANNYNYLCVFVSPLLPASFQTLFLLLLLYQQSNRHFRLGRLEPDRQFWISSHTVLLRLLLHLSS